MKSSLSIAVGLTLLLLIPMGTAHALLIADAGGPYEVTIGNSLTLDGSASTVDVTSLITSYKWDVDSNGSVDFASFFQPTSTLSAAFVDDLGVGTHSLTLTVTDIFGLASSANSYINVFEASTSTPAPVPEPTTLSMLLSGLAGLAAVRRLCQRGHASDAALDI